VRHTLSSFIGRIFTAVKTRTLSSENSAVRA